MAQARAQAHVQENNLLVASGLPICYTIENIKSLNLEMPDNRNGQTIRVWARSLSVMQKEAIVASTLTGRAWRLASDEGPYLNGYDAAPCPLSFLTVGMVSSYMNEILALAKLSNITVRDITLKQDNYYTMKGSALKGTMVGGALPVDLEVQIDADADDAQLFELVTNAVHASPLNGLMREVHTSLFTLTMNDTEIPVGRVAAIDGPAEPDPGDQFPRVEVGHASVSGELIQRLEATEAIEGVAGGAASSLQAEQDRKLHVQAICCLRPDGVKEITQHLFSPIGSTFQYLCDEAEGHGGAGAAPDAASYMAAGIAFCFMTQLGRYAKIVKKNLEEYKVVQDAHFSLGGASGGTGKPGIADPIETHVYLQTDEDAEFARMTLDMGEQTCFLHAFCRSKLKTKVKLTQK